MQLWAIPSTIASTPSVETETPNQASANFNPPGATSQLTTLHGFGPTGTKATDDVSSWLIGISRVWALGTVILIVRHWLGIWIYCRKLRRWPKFAESRITQLAKECRDVMGITRPIEIRVAHDLETPCLFGVFRPVLLMPANLLHALSDLEWRNILLHEFAHLRRRDPISNAWMSLVAIVHWSNPLVWWAVRRMREARELACDHLVLARADPVTIQSYGETLLKLASYPTTVLPSFRLEIVGILEGTGPLKARLLALKVRPVYWLNAALGMLALALLGSCALTRNPDVAEATQIYPIDLTNYTDFPRTLTDSNVLVRRQDDPGIWSQIPHGQQTFFGVPFEITGLVRLASRNSQRINAWYFRPEVNGIPIDRAFDRLYLLHTTFYYEKPGTDIARIRLNYADGRTAEIPIAYGTHTLNYWRQRYENTSQLTDSGSRIAWTGKAPPSIADYGNSLRLVVSSLKNPDPNRVVQSVDLISTWSDSSEVIVGMAVGGRALPQAWRDTPVSKYPKNDWHGVLRFRAVNAATGKPIRNMELRLEVAEPGVHSRIGTYHTDADGWSNLKFPHIDLNYLTIWADHPDYVPRLIQWTQRQHGPFPREYIYRAEPGNRIHGRIVDEGGAPISGALVRLYGPAPNFDGDGKEFLTLDHSSATTDADGRWSCSEIPAEAPTGRIGIRVLHPGFAPSSVQWLTPDQLGGVEIGTRLAKPNEF